MKLGINGANMKPWPLERQIVEASRVGFHGLELWQDKLEEYLAAHEVAELVDLLAAHEIEPTSICFVRVGFGDEQQPDRIQAMQKIVELAAAIGAPAVALVAARNPPPDLPKAEVLRLAGQEARLLAAIAADHGVSFYLEPIGMHPVTPSPLDALAIIQAAGSPNIKILFDVFHYYRSDVSLADIAAIPVELLGAIHVNDAEDRPKAELNDGMRLYPTLGVLPAAEMLRIPRDQGYDGYVTVEVFRQAYWDHDPDLAGNSMRYLKALLAQIPWEGGAQ
jgi:sugar phosphate isomerase/epimerase